MMRILTWLTGGLAILATGFVLFIVVTAQRQPPNEAALNAHAPQFVLRQAEAPPMPPVSLDASPANETATNAREAAASDAAPAELPEESAAEEEQAPVVIELPPWPKVEASFAGLREQRKEEPGAVFDLRSTYENLAAPWWSGSEEYPQHITKLAEWREELPESATALVVLAGAHVKWAWEARGGGWAGSVTQEGWELFHTRLTEARRLIEDAIKLGVPDGEAYRVLLVLAMAEGLPEEQTRAWLDAGRKVDPTYFPLYNQRAIGLMPRWGGEPGDIERFAGELVEMLPGDDGLEAFGRVAFAINSYECDDPVTLFWGQYDRKLLARAAEVLVKRYPDWQPLIQFAALATMAANDREAAKRIQPLVGAYDEESRIWPWQSTYKEYLDWCNAPTDPGGYERWIWGTHYSYGGLAFAPNDRYVWCGNSYGMQAVNLLDTEQGGVRMALPGLQSQLTNLTFDNNKKWVLGSMEVPSSEAFCGWVLWDTANPLNTLPFPTEKRCEDIAINPQKPQVAWIEGTRLRTFDVEQRKELKAIEISLPPDHRIHFARDGASLAMSTRPVTVWNTQTGEIRFQLPLRRMDSPEDPDFQHVVGFDADGSLFVTGTISPQRQTNPPTPPKQALVRVAPDGKTWETIIPNLSEHHEVDAFHSLLSPDCGLLAIAERHRGSVPQPIQIWDIESRRMVKRLGGHWNHHGTMAFSENGKKLATISRMGGAVKIWSLDDVAPMAPLADATAQQ